MHSHRLLPTLAVLVVVAGTQAVLGQEIVFPDDSTTPTAATTAAPLAAVSTTPIPVEVSTVAQNSTDTDSHVDAVQGLLLEAGGGTPAAAEDDDKVDLSASALGSRSVLQRQYASACRAPTGESGTCGIVRDCPGIYRIRDSRYLRSFLCGYQGRTPLVCCPARWSNSYYYQKPTTTTRAPSYGYGGYGNYYPQQQPQYNNYYGQQQQQPQYGSSSYNSYPQSNSYDRPSYVQPPYSQPSYSQYPQYPRPVNGLHFSTTTRRPAYVPTSPPAQQKASEETGVVGKRPPKPGFLPAKCGIGYGFSRIVGGSEARPGGYPWMAAIYIKSGNSWMQACGGALVSNKHVVTAAHCVVSGSRSQNLPTRIFMIRLGDHNLVRSDDLPEGVTVDVPVAKISRHSNFDSKTYKNDIAILELAEPVQFSEYIQPICLPYDGIYGNLDNEIAIVTGWGYTQYEGKGSDVLKQATIRIWPQSECKEAFKREVTITDEYLCAGDGSGKKDSCQGDSGGPLVYIEGPKFYLIGVVSFGKKCATPGYPGAYTRVTQYLDWLNEHF